MNKQLIQLLLSWCVFLFSWPPREVGSACDLCAEGRVLVQYAFSASSPMPCDPSGHWSPREAEGESQGWGQRRGAGEDGTEQKETPKDNGGIWERVTVNAEPEDR